MGRGASKIGGVSKSYLQGYLKNSPWLSNLPADTQKNMIDNFNNMPPEQQYYYSLSQAEQTALVQMQYNTQSINEYMSGRNTDFTENQKAEFDTQIENVKSAIAKYDLKEPITLYRGISEQEFNSIKSGGQTESFKSTSTDAARAGSFGQNQGGYTVVYQASAGARVADVNGVPSANEKEFLIDSGVRYKDVQKIGKTVYIKI